LGLPAHRLRTCALTEISTRPEIAALLGAPQNRLDRNMAHLKHRWNEEDAVRDELEEQAKRKFLEQEANQIFASIENYLTRLAEVLRAAGASVEVDAKWEHLGDQQLRRVAKVRSNESAQQLPLDFTIQEASIFYRDKRYRLLRGIEALMPVITSDVEQFFTSLRNQAVKSGS
jgi:hypothetical protein